MKTLATVITFFAWLGIPRSALGQCRNGQRSPRLPIGLKLTIRAEKPVAEISRPVIIFVEFSNQSGTPVSMSDRLASDLNYELYVRDSSGKELPLTENGRKIRTGPIKGSQNTVVLAPGEKYTAKDDFSGMYAISVPGSYTVEACRDLIDWGNMYSNKIVIAFVTPPLVP